MRFISPGPARGGPRNNFRITREARFRHGSPNSEHASIAVGTAVSGGPPHRSVREGLPPTAPPLGQTISTLGVDTRRDCRAAPIDVRSNTGFGTSTAVRQCFPSVTSFPRRIPPLRSQLCSPVSTVLRSHLTSQQRSCQKCPRGGSLPVPHRSEAIWKPRGSPGSRAWNVNTCTGSQTPPCPSIPHQYRNRRCCLLRVRTRSAHGSDAFGAGYPLGGLACVSSCRCHTRDVTIASVRFEARVTG